MDMKGLARYLAQRLDYDVVRTSRWHRKRLLATAGIDLVIDVGANVGQYASAMRRSGWAGRIVSFEPLSDQYRQLELAAGRDRLWETRHLALGRVPGRLEMRVASNNGASRSLLPMAESRHLDAAAVTTIGTQTVDVARLDDVALPGKVYYLKLDVQGYEPEVLAGAEETLAHTALLEAELSLVELYEGQLLFQDVVDLLRDNGLVLIGIEPEFADADTGEWLQVNGFFARPQGDR